jgi:hypothetical protein
MNDVVKVPELREPLIPLSHLALDLVDAPASGWTVWLAERGIAVAFDDLGRPSIARADAKQLLDDQRQNEIRRQDLAAQTERELVERDRAWRATLHPGLPWYEVPPGVLPVVAMTEAAKAEQPKRRTVLQDALDGGETTMHILPPTPVFEDES